MHFVHYPLCPTFAWSGHGHSKTKQRQVEVASMAMMHSRAIDRGTAAVCKAPPMVTSATTIVDKVGCPSHVSGVVSEKSGEARHQVPD